MPIQLLDSHYPWLARRGGFSQLPAALRLNGCEADVITQRKGFLPRAAGKLYSTWKGHSHRNQRAAASECEFLFRMRLRHSSGHVLFLEDHLPYLEPPTSREHWIGTIHLPRKSWTSLNPDRLRRIPAITVLCDYMADQFSDIVDTDQIKVIHYGVDANFFRPPAVMGESQTKRLVFVGAWLRNTVMLARLVPEILRKFPMVHFDFIVPLHARGDRAISTLLEHPAITWHHNLSDEELRSLYQGAAALILPMEDSGANNSVLEALACGLPIVTTDVGGIRSYGGGTIFPVVRNNDDSNFLDLVAAYLTDSQFWASVSRKSREFAETTLDWPVVAKEYIDAYRAFGCL
jgi:glycosyltransferase involved in cell wall biosynthesis